MSSGAAASTPKRTTNLIVWAALAAAVAGTGIARVVGLYPLASAELLVASLGALGRGLALGAVGLLLETRCGSAS